MINKLEKKKKAKNFAFFSNPKEYVALFFQVMIKC